MISWPSRVVQLPPDDDSHRPPVVTAVRLHRDGQQLATAGDDHRVRVWNLADGALIHKLDAHTDWVRTIDTRVQALPITRQQVITKDNVPVSIDGVLFFRVADAAGTHCWVLDFARGVARRSDVADPNGPCIDIPATVFNDCVSIRMFSAWTASKRLRIRLRSPADLKRVNSIFSLLDFHELDMLPLHRNFSARSLAVRLRRWRDAVEAGNLLLKHRILGRRFDIAALYALPTAHEGR